MALQGGLHLQVRARLQLLRGDEGRRERCCSAKPLPIEGVGVVLHELGARPPVALEHAALVLEIEHRLDAGGDIAGQQRDGASRRDRGDEAVAHAVARDRAAHLLGQGLQVRRLKDALRVIERKCAFSRASSALAR
jgi:hypothetical protein